MTAPGVWDFLAITERTPRYWVWISGFLWGVVFGLWAAR